MNSVRAAVIALTCLLPLAAWSAQSAGAERPISFSDDIRPILNKNCIGCHGGVKKAGKISFLFREDAMSKGKSGSVPVVPGKPAESFLLERITDKSDPMPPEEHGPMLAQKDVDLLRRWIQQGARWQNHWAFEKPVQPKLPKVKNRSWAKSDLDRFILARLESEGLAPEQEQDKARWIRRVSLDLTGLPPTPGEVETFVADKSFKAHEKLVDRLLASPHFGERWAAMWLDLVRYADSKGLGQDQNREIWKFRDWVVDAFNRDMPFDEFTARQLAGDLLPNATIEDRIASACHRNTASNDEGGTDDEEFRIESVIDRVNTTWQVWQGVTFGCVQCHTHPYDPFKHEEYYRFFAIFNQTRDVDTRPDHPTIRVPLAKEDYPKATALDREIATLRGGLHSVVAKLAGGSDVWKPLTGISVNASGCGSTVEKHGGREEFKLTGTVPQRTRITIEAAMPAGTIQLTALRLDALPLDPETAKQLTEWGFVLNDLKVSLIADGATNEQAVRFTHAFSDEPEPFSNPEGSLAPEPETAKPDAKATTKAAPRRMRGGGFAAFTRIDRDRWGVFVPAEPVAVSAGSRIRVVMTFNDVAQDAFPLVMKRGHIAVSADPRWSQLVKAPERLAQQETLAAKVAERTAFKSASLPVMQELPDNLRRPTALFVRGNWMTRGPAVTPGVPGLLPPLPKGSQPDRLGVARWLTSSENPLTARVLANRLWEQLFGLGIVETLEDFGSSGEKPTHPELLDWLAIRLQQDHRWSVKKMLRELVLSATYRQDNRITADKLARDPRNRLLSRGPRQRLGAEMVRDQALAVSGLLNPKLAGPPVFPPLPAGVWDPFIGGEKWPTPKPGEPDRYRRALYTHVKRSIPYPATATFDAPSREVCTQRRILSNTPVQALATLNDAVFREAAVALAGRMTAAAPDVPGQLAAGYKLATGRPVALSVLQRLTALHEGSLSLTQNAGAALENVASVLLNLDEVLTK